MNFVQKNHIITDQPITITTFLACGSDGDERRSQRVLYPSDSDSSVFLREICGTCVCESPGPSAELLSNNRSRDEDHKPTFGKNRKATMSRTAICNSLFCFRRISKALFSVYDAVFNTSTQTHTSACNFTSLALRLTVRTSAFMDWTTPASSTGGESSRLVSVNMIFEIQYTQLFRKTLCKEVLKIDFNFLNS